MTTRSDQSLVHVPPRQLRDGLLLVALGLVVAMWIGYGVVGVVIGLAIAAWGLVLAGNAIWARNRRGRT